MTKAAEFNQQRSHEPRTVARAQARSFDTRLFLLVVVCCMLVLNFTLFYLNRQGLPHRDFKIFYVGALIFNSHRGADLYDFGLQRRLQTELLHIRPEEALPYNHPPFELLVFSPFACLSFAEAFYLWLAISAGLGIISAALLARKLRRLSEPWAMLPHALVVCLFPFLMCLLQGQDSALALILLVACWLSFRNRSDERLGFLLGLGLFKFTIFLPLAFILAFRRPKLLRGYGLSAVLVALISVVIVRPAGLVSYVRLLLHMARASSSGISFQFGMDPRLMPDLRGLIYGIASHGRDTIPAASVNVVLAALFLVSAGLLVWGVRQTQQTRAMAWNSDESNDLVFALAVITSVLLSFHLLAHDLTVLAVPFAIVLNRVLIPTAKRKLRYFVLLGLICLFYPLAVYLFLFAWSLVFLLGAVILALAFLVSRELRDASLEAQLATARTE